MEELVVPFKGIYAGRRVLVTGHTGFKGSWLTLWLEELGARVTGISLPPATTPNHWDLLDLQVEDLRLDVRDAAPLTRKLAELRPEIVFHLAAQPLVRRSYRDPLETWSTNVMGTANLLEACRLTPSVRGIVVVTTDKVYENSEWHWGYREIDRLGGHDPYSASKAAAELVAESYRKSFFSGDGAPLLATVRAGNVIGGGDWSQDRLIPDAVRSIASGESLEIRSPFSTRPWQHVLECLSGYLLLGELLLEGEKDCAEAWNFGPSPEDNRSVSEVLSMLSRHWEGFQWHRSPHPTFHEAGQLYLDSSKARTSLGWRPVWGLEKALEQTARWYREQLEHNRAATRDQLHNYVAAAGSASLPWCAA
jgi:CDP-glucose 4,6-dehydratase